MIFILKEQKNFKRFNENGQYIFESVKLSSLIFIFFTLNDFYKSKRLETK